YNICNVLTEIISDWNLTKKVFTLITDNGLNMIKVGALMTELTQLTCSTHILQLVIRKGLLPVEVLIARAKYLINFFTTSKQIEKLIEIQKNNSHKFLNCKLD
ncbi:7961_t:CDS:1, partial [Diversispora eburnea]